MPCIGARSRCRQCQSTSKKRGLGMEFKRYWFKQIELEEKQRDVIGFSSRCKCSMRVDIVKT